MADGRSTRSRPSIRGSADRARGYSLIEVLTALAVASVALGAALTLTLSSREGYTNDQNRTQINQNLRGSLDLMGIEVRQAGERLPSDFPALEIGDGTSGAPDTLTLRRNLVDIVLPVCGDLSQGSTDSEVQVADSGGSPAQGCQPLPDTDGNGWPDNIDAWRSYLASRGGSTWAYVYNPVAHAGEWFEYDGDGSDADHLSRGDGEAWLRDYGVNQQCRIYLLEQRVYRLQGDLLQFLFNADDQNPINLGAGILDFQAIARFADGSVSTQLDASTSWAGLSAIEITLTGESRFDGRTLTRDLTARFFPRNVLSH